MMGLTHKVAYAVSPIHKFKKILRKYEVFFN
jgi:hypothetical protein